MTIMVLTTVTTMTEPTTMTHATGIHQVTYWLRDKDMDYHSTVSEGLLWTKK